MRPRLLMEKGRHMRHMRPRLLMEKGRHMRQRLLMEKGRHMRLFASTLFSTIRKAKRFASYSMFRGVVTTFISQLRLSFTRSAISGIKS